jgi:23S rRNA (cytosine1962-C5)-methyltransferase
VRDLEGLPRLVEVVHGEVPDVVVVREGPVEYEADLRLGQKTGLFLDQRENREAAARYARGRLLDCFCYDGGFALRLAGLCERVEALDSSEEAVARTRANAARNGVVLDARVANVFDELRRLEKAGARYETIVLDPPAFARSKAALEGAVAGYKEINLRAMRLLVPGGHLITCTCSYHMHRELFAEMLHAASIDSHAPMVLVEMRGQARDHPVLVGVPETSYLTCAILRRVE